MGRAPASSLCGPRMDLTRKVFSAERGSALIGRWVAKRWENEHGVDDESKELKGQLYVAKITGFNEKCAESQGPSLLSRLNSHSLLFCCHTGRRRSRSCTPLTAMRRSGAMMTSTTDCCHLASGTRRGLSVDLSESNESSSTRSVRRTLAHCYAARPATPMAVLTSCTHLP